LLNVELDGEHESIRDYIHRVESIRRQELTLMGEEVSDREVITGLGEKYEGMVETFDNLNDYTLQQVKVKLTSREERMQQVRAVSEARARKSQLAAGYPSATQQPQGENAFFAQKGKTRSSIDGGTGQQKR
jgi:hypothetical protein